MEELDRALKETAALLGRAEELDKTRRSLEQTRAQRQALLPRLEEARGALAAEQGRQPQREALAKELAALEAELPRYQELTGKQAALDALEERISGLKERQEQLVRARQGQADRLSEWKKEAEGLSQAEAEQARLSGEQSMAQSRRAALDALARDMAEWKNYGAQLQESQTRREALSRQWEQLAGEVSRQSSALQASRETWSATEGLEAEGEKRAAIDALARRYFPGDTAEHRQAYIDREWAGVALLELAVEHLSGKQATELVQAKGET